MTLRPSVLFPFPYSARRRFATSSPIATFSALCLHRKYGSKSRGRPQGSLSALGNLRPNPLDSAAGFEIRISERKTEKMKLNTYLNYGGNCAEAFKFYEKDLGGKIISMMTFDQAPDPSQIPPGVGKGVLHARLELGGAVLMGSDVPGGRHQPMRSAYLSLSVESSDEAERIHALLAE